MTEQRQKKRSLPVLPIVFVCILLVLAVYLGGFFYFRSHFFRGTVIDRVDVSGMTIGELKEQIESYSLRVFERMADGTALEEEIRGKDIGLTYASTEPLQEFLEEQNTWLWFIPRTAEHRTQELVTYQAEALEAQIRSLQGFQSDLVVPAQDAYISDEDPEAGYQIVEEVRGNELDWDRTQEIIQTAVEGLEEQVDLDEAGCYVEPEVTADNEQLLQTLEKLQSYEGIQITYTFGDNKEVLDGKTILSWLTVDGFEITLDQTKVEEFVAGLRKKYDTIFRPRSFVTSYGTAVTISSGDYGWWMNYEQEARELAEMIENGQSGERTPVYYQTAASYGTPDYGTTYVEINLTAQHLFLYKDGKLILESDFVSGNSARGYDTPAGIYGITYKQRNATLTGEDYETPVSFWMPFNGNIGMHDATWRRTFGADIYKTGGSHGCVNLPYSAAQKIYEYVEKGTPVICYHLPGTEAVPAADNPEANTDTNANEETGTDAEISIDAVPEAE